VLFNLNLPTSGRNQMRGIQTISAHHHNHLAAYRETDSTTDWSVADAGRTAMLKIPMTTMLLSASLLAGAPSLVPMAQPAAVEQELPDSQALLPVAAVFFLPKSSALSALALDIVAQAAHQADAGAIVLIRANHDREAGETAQTALLRGDAVRDELIRQGVPKSAVRILISAATRTGIEARSVVVSFPAAIDESRGMTSCS
jgi:hypothetical protein